MNGLPKCHNSRLRRVIQDGKPVDVVGLDRGLRLVSQITAIRTIRTTLMLSIALLLWGCDRRSIKNYELDRNSFNAKHLRMVEEYTGVKLPPGSSGVNLLYKGNQIDAELLAKVQIPIDSVITFTNQLSRIPSIDEHVDSRLTAEVNWWSVPNETLLMQHFFTHGNNLVRVFLTEENGHSIVYFEWYQ